jgi:predicted DNA-binding transcriptional regulator YafY
MPAVAARSALNRLLQLLLALQSGQGRNARELAGMCGVSRRTIYRDLATLAEAGVPVYYDAERQGYQLAAKFAFQAPGLAEREVAALLILLHQVAGEREGLGFCREAQSAVWKVVNVLPAELRQRASALAAMIRLPDRALDLAPEWGPVSDAIWEAMASRRQVRIGYQAPGASTEESTKVSPYRMVLDRGVWTLVGRSTLHREVRAFRLPDVRRAIVTDDPYEVPPRFRLDRFLGLGWLPSPEAEAPEVWLRFAAAVAGRVREIVWHPAQRLEPRPDGAVDLRFASTDLDALLGWILSWGEQVEVLAPAALRDRLRAVAENLAQRYRPRPHCVERSGVAG